MKFIRTFHPVGQGAFFTEKIIDNEDNIVFTAVYDCGCTTKSPLNKVIPLAIEEKEHINLICISHFDIDHISGLVQLINRATIDEDTVIMIPFAYPDALVVLDQQISKIISFFQSKKAHLVGIRGVNIRNFEDFNETRNLSNLNNREIINSGTKIRVDLCQEPLWYYIPLMHKENFDHVLNEFEHEIDEALKRKQQNQEELDFSEEELRKIYQGLHSVAPQGRTSTINMNSLMLLSYPDDKDKYRTNTGYIFNHCDCCFGCRNILPSCLYTGDTNLSNSSLFDKLLNIADSYCENPLGLLQIPHHGSKNNYNSHIAANDKYQMAFVNFNPLRNIYFRKISEDYLFKYRPLITITNDPLTEFIQFFNI